MKNLLLLYIGCFFSASNLAQQINLDHKAGAINIPLPKTPESQAFERYGSIPVSEATGSANFSVPIYTVKSKFLELPITLSYNASGIRVNQEASWVGLGFDLVAGGRITVDVKGTIDNDGASKFLYSISQLRYGMQKLFHRLGDSSNSAIWTFASTCQIWDTITTQNIPDDWGSVNAMAEFGLGEPDVFHANFLGNSIDFYFDKLDGSLKFLGEKSLFKLDLNKDGNDRISDWIITDNLGIKYYFAVKEITEVFNPSFPGLFGTSSTSAWLLSKILHPSGDSIALGYTNYGNTSPAFNWTASFSSSSGLSNDSYQNYIKQYPSYLSQIQTSSQTINFVMSTRLDLRGTGSRKLSEIQITDRASSALIKKIKFSYDYFNCVASGYTNNLADSLKNYAKLRLKLTKLFLGDSALMNPYKFYYYRADAVAADKFSFSQDHWGFYNGQATYGSSPRALIPTYTNEIGTTSNPLYYDYLAFVAPNNTSSFTANRNCNPFYLPFMTMDSIIYPTGGSTRLIYEAHNGSNSPIGGGLRIKSIINYNLSRFVGRTDYTYSGGVCMGSIRYQTITYGLSASESSSAATEVSSRIKGVVSSNGFYNESKFFIVYANVIQKQVDSFGLANGSLTKIFIANNPRSTTAGANGYYCQPAHWPNGTINYSGSQTSYVNTTFPLFPNSAALPNTPFDELNAKLQQELYYDNNNNLVKSTTYHYRLADFSKKFYSIKAIDNRIGVASGYGTEFVVDGARRYSVLVSPGKSFFTLTDSIVEKTFQGTNIISIKKSFKYNNYYQPEYVSIENSDGTKDIIYTKTSLSYKDQAIASGNYSFYGKIISEHTYDLPLEQIKIKRNKNGDSLVTQAAYFEYDAAIKNKTFVLETREPILYKTQFQPGYLAGGVINYDSKYKLQTSAILSLDKLVTDFSTSSEKKAFIWDNLSNNLMAQGLNASSGEIAYSSFETVMKGNWNYTGNPVNDIIYLTGKKCYHLSAGNIYKGGLNTLGAYYVSYWSNNGQQTVSNTASIVTGKTVRNWTYFEHLVNNPTNGLVTVSGTGYIDELRLYPKGSFITSLSYNPFGLSSQVDPNNRLTYYEYDDLNRLMMVRDQDNNILKKYCYNYYNLATSCNVYYNDLKYGTFTKNNCSSGYSGNTITYTVPANIYSSIISKGEANNKAIADVSANGQTYANAVGICTPIANCDGSNCTGIGKKCVYGLCETGVKIYTSSVQVHGSLWECTYHFEWSNGTWSQNYIESQSIMCLIEN